MIPFLIGIFTGSVIMFITIMVLIYKEGLRR